MAPTSGACCAGIDVGQSGLRISIAGRRLHHGTGYLDDRGLVGVADAIAHTWPAATARTIGVGLTGDHSGHDLDTLAARLAEIAGATEVRLAHDSLTAHLGALAGADGVVLSVGTGTAALAVVGRRTRRLDGWGHLLGDEGSGYAVGRAGLRAAAAALDERGPASLLLDEAVHRFGDLRALRARHLPVAKVADFARSVAAAARANDAVAGAIWSEASRALTATCETGIAWCRRQGLDPVPVCAVGGLLAADELLTVPWLHSLDAHPSVVLVEPIGDGLDGALRLARMTPDEATKIGARTTATGAPLNRDGG